MNTQIIPQQSRPVPPGAIDVWSQSQSGTQLGFHQPQASQVSPVQKVQRLLRGKIALAIVLGLAGAAVGAVAGYLSQSPEYRAQGKLEIRPTIERLVKDTNISFYQQFMASQAQTIASPKIMNMIPNTEPWKSSKYADDKSAIAAIGSGLRTTYLKNTFNIDVQVDAQDKDLASIGVQSVINAYQSQYKSNNTDGLDRKIREFEARSRELESQSRSSEKLISDLTSKYGSDDLEPRVSALQREVEDIARELRGYENNFKAAVGAIEAMNNGQIKTPIEELAQVDAALAQMLQEVKAKSLRLQMMKSNFGENHPKVKEERGQLDAISKAAEEYADTLRKEILAIIPDFVKGGYMKVTPGQLRVLEARVVQLKADLAEYERRRDALAADAGKVASYKLVIKDAADDQTKVRAQLDDLRYQIASQGGELSIMNDGRYPSPIQNKRVMFGLLGGMVGCALPIGLLMLLGLMDTRFKYSDDAAGSAMSGIPLLGILPNLPDRLSDPAQASIAAHCVHQIRTMLQLNAMRQDGSTVFSVTSASSGDGKTSLSLALGLSFAASGSRTLLIDADLVGGGLTSRLGNNSPLGIVDALAGVGLDDCIQPTDVADLAILPIGSAQAHHAGGFSPPAVRKLLGEARKHYEVIIVDTGPVMGSIEATPICASVDGVVLTVARGQSRPLVERAITHLQSIGARVCGVVFNRAQHKDFEQSIGAISIRSAARSTVNGSGHNARNPGDIGAVAKAVATSVRSEN